METIYSLLVLINEHARMNNEDEMHAEIQKADSILKKIGMEIVRDEDHQCYTVGVTEYIQEPY